MKPILIQSKFSIQIKKEGAFYLPVWLHGVCNSVLGSFVWRIEAGSF